MTWAAPAPIKNLTNYLLFSGSAKGILLLYARRNWIEFQKKFEYYKAHSLNVWQVVDLNKLSNNVVYSNIFTSEFIRVLKTL